MRRNATGSELQPLTLIELLPLAEYVRANQIERDVIRQVLDALGAQRLRRDGRVADKQQTSALRGAGGGGASDGGPGGAALVVGFRCVLLRALFLALESVIVMC